LHYGRHIKHHPGFIVDADPEKSDLYRIVFNYHEVLEQVWEERYQSTYGCYRDEVKDAFNKYLDCGIVAHGCARVE